MSKLSVETRLRIEALQAAALSSATDVLPLAEQYFDWLRQETHLVTQADVLRKIESVGKREPWSGDNTYGEGVEDSRAAVRALFTGVPAVSRFRTPDSTMPPCGDPIPLTGDGDAPAPTCDLVAGHTGRHSGGGFDWTNEAD